MKCVICHGEDISLKQVKEELTSGTDIIHVSVTVPVCRTCGERYYDLRTMRYLEETARKLRDNELELRTVGLVMEAV